MTWNDTSTNYAIQGGGGTFTVQDAVITTHATPTTSAATGVGSFQNITYSYGTGSTTALDASGTTLVFNGSGSLTSIASSGSTLTAATASQVAAYKGIDPFVNNSFGNITTSLLEPGSVAVEYIDPNGSLVGSAFELYAYTSAAGYAAGQVVNIINTTQVQSGVPTNYMLASGAQVWSGAVSDAQALGNPNAATDNGDAYGQAQFAIVPAIGTTYTYKVYVYGNPEAVTYQYVDAVTVSTVALGSVSASDPVTANYGNTTDWTNSLYTATNVPSS